MERYGVELPPTAVLDFPTAAALAEHILHTSTPREAVHDPLQNIDTDMWSLSCEQGQHIHIFFMPAQLLLSHVPTG